MALRRDQSAVVDREVRELLGRSRAFRSLPPRDRAQIAERTARIASHMVAGQLGATMARPRRRIPDDPYALAFADTTTSQPGGTTGSSANGATPDRWRADERFQAEATAAGVTQAGRMVREVDFPAFVSSLVKGTFQAVVDASIQQMEAYGQLVQSVAQSLDDFADNFTETDGQQKLVSKYPSVFEMATEPGSSTSKLKVKDDFDSDEMPDFKELGLAEPVTDLDDETLPRLVNAAKLELARGRQQLLATTILMGINRIIVTDGSINAKIVFNFNATDTVKRDGAARSYEEQQRATDYSYSVGRQLVKGHYERSVPVMVADSTAHTEATIDAHAKLTGEVKLNFRSETFPLERMMSSDQMFQLNQAQSGARGTPAPAAAPPPATPRGA